MAFLLCVRADEPRPRTLLRICDELTNLAECRFHEMPLKVGRRDCAQPAHLEGLPGPAQEPSEALRLPYVRQSWPEVAFGSSIGLNILLRPQWSKSRVVSRTDFPRHAGASSAIDRPQGTSKPSVGLPQAFSTMFVRPHLM